MRKKKRMSSGLCLGGITQEGTMISNLPLLFADGYPTCLERITVGQLEKFVPFMIRCSLGHVTIGQRTAPKWWPRDIKFSIPLVKPSGVDTKWHGMLKNLVFRCYTYHGCEFMLRFCTDLSQCPTSELTFIDSWDNTTSLYNRISGKLLVTFRNENMTYDRKRESPRKTLLPKNDGDLGRPQMIMHPPLFDIYLCDSCDAEFNTLKEIQKHEKTCCKVNLAILPESALQIDELCRDPTEQEAYLSYFELLNTPQISVRGCSESQHDPPRYKRAVVNSLRYAGIPFSSPLGIFLHRKSRTSLTGVQMERIERYCSGSTKPSDSGNSRSRESRNGDIWPVSWKCRKGDDWAHSYKFPKRQWRRRSPCMQTDANETNQKLLAMCKPLEIRLKRLTSEEIEWYTTQKYITTSNDTCSVSYADVADAAASGSTSYMDFNSYSTSDCGNSDNSASRNYNNSHPEHDDSRSRYFVYNLPPLDVTDPSYGEEPSNLEYAYRNSLISRGIIDSVGVPSTATKLGPNFSVETQLLPNTLYVYDTTLSHKQINSEVSAIPIIDLCSSDEESELPLRDTSEQLNASRANGVSSQETHYSCLTAVSKSQAQVGGVDGCNVHPNVRTSENQVVPTRSSDYRNSLCRTDLFTPKVVDYYQDSESSDCVCVNATSQREAQLVKISENGRRKCSNPVHFQNGGHTEKSLLASCGFNLTPHHAFPQEYSPVEAEVACTVPVQDGTHNWRQDQVDFHCQSDLEGRFAQSVQVFDAAVN